MSEGISIVVPVFNEEKGIASTVKHLGEMAEKFDLPYEILFVNDGSTDTTGDLLKGLTQLPNMTLHHHLVNRGYGAALKTGIKHSKYDLIVITDADETYPNERIPELVGMMAEGYDMVVGARTGNNVNIPLIRRPPKWCIGQLANYLSGRKIPDINSGLRVMRKPVLLKYLNLLPQGFSFTTTITLAMLTNNHPVKYEPIDYHHRAGTSKIKPIRDTLNFVQLIIRTVMYFNPLKVFLPVSFVFLLVGFCMLAARFIMTDPKFAVSTSLFIFTGIMLLAIGMLADLIDKRMG